MSKTASSPSGVPNGEHFAIIEFSTIYIPGDERSRTHPGHGYGESSESVCKYVVYDTQKDWEDEINRRMNSVYISNKNNFVAIKANPAQIKTSINISV
jgi:hypothetical protein